MNTVSGDKSDIETLTFGCRLNALESDEMRACAVRAGLRGVLIVNSCAVTAEAERQLRQALRRARRIDPGRPIILTGCAAHISPERYGPFADHVIDNTAKLDMENWRHAARHLAGAETSLPPILRPTIRSTGTKQGRARALYRIQTGCDHHCTFCVIPQGRGPSRSVPIPEAVEGVRELVEANAAEIVLTGVDIASWGQDLGGTPRLGDLVRSLLDGVPLLRRLRLSSLDPAFMDDGLFDCLSEGRLTPHIHLSLQSGDDLVLKRMRRRHLRADVIELIDRLRRSAPQLALGADIIAGFPTESEDAHLRTMELLEELGFAYLHVFPYSPRPGTPAARMKGHSTETARRRARELGVLGEILTGRFLRARIFSRTEIVVEKRLPSGVVGRCPRFTSLFVPLPDGEEVKIGGVMEVLVTGEGHAERV